MKVSKISMVFGLACLGWQFGCSSDSDDTAASPTELTALFSAQQVLENLSGELKAAYDGAPGTYTFTRDGVSTVSYSGQVFRQVLIEDIKTYIGSLERGTYPGTADDVLAALYSYVNYSFDNADEASGVISGASNFKVTATGLEGQSLPFTEGETYAAIQDPGKNLLGKLAGNDNESGPRDQFLGWNATQFLGQDLATIDYDANASATEPEDLLAAWLRIIANSAVDGQVFTVANGDLEAQSISAAYLTETGLDLSQLVQKFLHGAVSFSQASDDYLSVTRGEEKGILANNTEPAKPGVTYTPREHHWDEAFGYFGAATDYLNYTDSQIAKKLSLDTNSNGSIAMLEEKNLGIAINAAKRDLGSSNTTDFTQNIMDAFIKGRHFIATQPEGYEPVLASLATVIRIEWERVIVATVVHYINKTIAEMDEYGTEAYLFTDHAKFWSEMKGFALGLQFSPEKILSDAEFTELHKLMGDQPVLGSADAGAVADYRASLLKGRDMLQTKFGFGSDAVANW